MRHDANQFEALMPLSAEYCERWKGAGPPTEPHTLQLLTCVSGLLQQQQEEEEEEEVDFSVYELISELPSLLKYGRGQGWQTSRDAELAAQQRSARVDESYKPAEGGAPPAAAGGTRRQLRKREALDSAQLEVEAEAEEAEEAEEASAGSRSPAGLLAGWVTVAGGELQPLASAIFAAAENGDEAALALLQSSSTAELQLLPSRLASIESGKLRMSGKPFS